MAKEPSEAAGIIGMLHERGWSDSAIGRAVGRDSSLIHQAAVGKKPVHNLVPALRAIAQSGEPGPAKGARETPVHVGPITSRTTRSGQPARVRGTAEPLPGGSYLETKRGAKSILNEVREAAKNGRKVQLTIQYSRVAKYGRRGANGRPEYEKHGEVQLYNKRGYDAKTLLDRIENPDIARDGSLAWKPGDVMGALKELSLDARYVDYVGSIERVELLTFSPD